VAKSPQEIIEKSEYVFLAVKPQVVPGLLKQIVPYVTNENVMVSIAAGIGLSQLTTSLENKCPVIRVMPNVACLVGQSASAVSHLPSVPASKLEMVLSIFNNIGVAVTVDESQMDAVTGLSGSGPAFVFAFAEALADAGVRVGLPRHVSSLLANQLLKGSAEMLTNPGEGNQTPHPAALKDTITSPGGTTIAGLHALESRAFRAAVYDAVYAAAMRAKDLGSKL